MGIRRKSNGDTGAEEIHKLPPHLGHLMSFDPFHSSLAATGYQFNMYPGSSNAQMFPHPVYGHPHMFAAAAATATTTTTTAAATTTGVTLEQINNVISRASSELPYQYPVHRPIAPPQKLPDSSTYSSTSSEAAAVPAIKQEYRVPAPLAPLALMNSLGKMSQLSKNLGFGNFYAMQMRMQQLPEHSNYPFVPAGKAPASVSGNSSASAAYSMQPSDRDQLPDYLSALMFDPLCNSDNEGYPGTPNFDDLFPALEE